MLLSRLLAHPLTKRLDLDAPETTALRQEIVKSKPFLRSIYQDWYHLIANSIPRGDGEVLELGSGGGFLGDILRETITSDVFEVPGVDIAADARELPFASGSLKAIVMTNVFHHISDVSRFLSEAQRTLRPGGRIVMIEPWNTSWSRFIHEKFHDEPMVNDVKEWEFPQTGPLSGANAALAWVVTERDKEQLEYRWPSLRVNQTDPLMPFRYILSGGVSLRSLQPGWLYPLWKSIDEWTFLKNRISVFALIVIDRA